MKFEIELSGASGKKKHVVELWQEGSVCGIKLDGQAVEADAVQVSPTTVSVILAGQSFEIHVSPSADGKIKLQCGPHEYSAQVLDPRTSRGRKQGTLEVEGRAEIVAPMPGRVIRLLVAAGDAVEAGQGLLVVEAMKMQNEIRSPKSGKIERLLAREGQNVNAGDVLAWVD
jgi:biotin carboxyl carrier protein